MRRTTVGTTAAAAAIDVAPRQLRRWVDGDGLAADLPPPPHRVVQGERRVLRFDVEKLKAWNERRLEPLLLALRITELTYTLPEKRNSVVRALSRRPVADLRREVAWWEAAGA